MPTQRPVESAPNDDDPQDAISAHGLKPVPRGSVYGFMFPFDGNARHPHPGIVILSMVGKRNGVDQVGVVALAISHSKQEVSWKDNKALLIPHDEKQLMGLDAKEQWVCLFEQATVYFPDDIKEIKSAGGAYLGQASREFTDKVYDAWDDYRKS